MTLPMRWAFLTRLRPPRNVSTHEGQEKGKVALAPQMCRSTKALFMTV